MVDFAEIERVAARLGEASNADCVILFGSHARGDAGEYGDVDLLIVAESDSPRFKRTRGLYKLLRPYPFAMDLIVYTPEEVARGKKFPGSFVSSVLREGKTLYVRIAKKSTRSTHAIRRGDSLSRRLVDAFRRRCSTSTRSRKSSVVLASGSHAGNLLGFVNNPAGKWPSRYITAK